MKLCKDCKHCIPFESRFLFWRIRVRWDLSQCRIITREPDTGYRYTGGPPPKPELGYCVSARTSGKCGPDGKLFEPLETKHG